MFRRNRLLRSLGFAACLLAVARPGVHAQSTPDRAAVPAAPEKVVRALFDAALSHGQMYDDLRELVTRYPGRLAGSPNLAGAIDWAEQTLTAVGVDRVYRQEVLVPHWERGAKESVVLLGAAGEVGPLNALALGGSVATDSAGLVAEVVEVQSLDEVVTLGHGKIAGKIVFFNQPMDPTLVRPNEAYSLAGKQRSRGPGLAAKYGAVGALTRSLTHAHDDVPHTGGTTYQPDGPKIPAAALSTVAADRLSAALKSAAQTGRTVRVAMKINSRLLPDAPSHNIIGEIRGTERPDEIILVGGHIDSWDIAPGAHDDGAGVVQSMEVLRLFRSLGLKPRHTLRCVLFTNEENGLRGSTAYISAARERGEKHLLALETDNGGFQPHGFNLGSPLGSPHERAAAKWGALFAPYGIVSFIKGTGGADVSGLMPLGTTVGELTPDSQRYFDYHHTTADSLDKVNPRELQLGAGALAALIWLVDTQGL